MATQYKVWVQIEAVNEDADECSDAYSNVSEPNCLAVFDSQELAEAFELGLIHQAAQ